MQQQIQNVIYTSTLCKCLIKPWPKQFPTQVLAGSLNKQCVNKLSAVFHGDVWRSILIENIDSSSKGHIFARTVLLFIDMDTCSPICHSVRDPPCDTPPPSCDIMRLLLKHPVPPRASHIL